MVINRKQWYKLIYRNNPIKYPCPRCDSGTVGLVKEEIQISEPSYSENLHPDGPPEPYSSVERWSAKLLCDNKSCGEIIHITGDSETVEVEEYHKDYGVGFEYVDMLRIRTAYPPLYLFRIPDSVPKEVRDHLVVSFQMYWTDTSTCIARLRTSVEAMLADKNVPKTRLSKSGKQVRMTLNDRINAFALGSTHTNELHGLRVIGNFGTHGSDEVSDEELFDAFDIYENVLSGIYENNSIQAKASKLANKQ